MNKRFFISDPITCNARSELYITDVSMQTQNFLFRFHANTQHILCFIFTVKVAQDVEDVLEDFVRHVNLSYA